MTSNGRMVDRRENTEPSLQAGRGRRAADRLPAEMRVLVVDDDVVDRMAVRRALAATGLAIVVGEAEGVLAAIGMLTTQPVDCVFLDYNLPDGDGLTFLRGVRAAGLEVPVVMLTGQADEEVANDLLRSGAADYVSKAALSPVRLVESLGRALGVV